VYNYHIGFSVCLKIFTLYGSTSNFVAVIYTSAVERSKSQQYIVQRIFINMYQYTVCVPVLYLLRLILFLFGFVRIDCWGRTGELLAGPASLWRQSGLPAPLTSHRWEGVGREGGVILDLLVQYSLQKLGRNLGEREKGSDEKVTSGKFILSVGFGMVYA
jgi:hypothetical protein